ncbi:hypothetical protein EYC80_004556 [Monilinia laxa]|uniref:Uncharacterized protein n=1 Tax=Monilinia laxa TaxID=61186 RepID=A0A5N6KHE6_MONLA|nr:hypothetical protein EYC80_004556 [Monilinia laxa]
MSETENDLTSPYDIHNFSSTPHNRPRPAKDPLLTGHYWSNCAPSIQSLKLDSIQRYPTQIFFHGTNK